MSEKNIALKLTDVEFRRRKRVILTKVNLEINKGEKWVLFGPNGIGKSSLVQMMSTRGFPSEGPVDILGNRLGKVDVFSYRNRIGLSSAELSRAFPPQEDPLDAIVTALTATTGRWRDTYTDEDYAKARSLMREFGIEYLEGKIGVKADDFKLQWKVQGFSTGFSEEAAQHLESIQKWAHDHGKYDSDYNVRDFIDTRAAKIAFPDKTTVKNTKK